MRSPIYTTLVKAGVSPSDASQIEDLGKHAATEAMQALVRVIDAAPDGWRLHAFVVSMLYLSGQIESLQSQIKEVALSQLNE